MLAVLLALATAVCWGTNALFARRGMLDVHFTIASFYGLLAGLVIVAAFSYFSGDLAVLPYLHAQQFLVFAAVGIESVLTWGHSVGVD